MILFTKAAVTTELGLSVDLSISVQEENMHLWFKGAQEIFLSGHSCCRKWQLCPNCVDIFYYRPTASQSGTSFLLQFEGAAQKFVHMFTFSKPNSVQLSQKYCPIEPSLLDFLFCWYKQMSIIKLAPDQRSLMNLKSDPRLGWAMGNLTSKKFTLWNK